MPFRFALKLLSSDRSQILSDASNELFIDSQCDDGFCMREISEEVSKWCIVADFIVYLLFRISQNAIFFRNTACGSCFKSHIACLWLLHYSILLALKYMIGTIFLNEVVNFHLVATSGRFY